ncbi:MAG: Sec-independent protein translocase protein TatB [Burkholderiales bacterium]|nr:Sec-independent protein translocase protein TatB [Burkholderiales bacterium]
MFDIGFSEMLIIAVVALIVIGPERLPKVARTLGHLFGRMQRYVGDVKADISREMQLEELRALQNSMQDAARSIEQTVSKEVSAAESDFKQIADMPAAENAAPVADTNDAALPQPPPGLSASGPVSPQLELGLDSKPQKQA